MVFVESASVEEAYTNAVNTGDIVSLLSLDEKLAQKMMGHETYTICVGLREIARKFPEKIPEVMETIRPAADYTGPNPNVSVVHVAIQALVEFGENDEKPFLAEILRENGKSAGCEYNNFRQKAIIESVINKCKTTHENPLYLLSELAGTNYPPVHALISPKPLLVQDDTLYIETEMLKSVMSHCSDNIKTELEQTYRLVYSPSNTG